MFSLGPQEIVVILFGGALYLVTLVGVVGGIMYLFERRKLLAGCRPPADTIPDR